MAESHYVESRQQGENVRMGRDAGSESGCLDSFLQRTVTGSNQRTRLDPRMITPSTMLALQRTAGNAAVNQLLHRMRSADAPPPSAEHGPTDLSAASSEGNLEPASTKAPIEDPLQRRTGNPAEPEPGAAGRLPVALRVGIERLSGIAVDDVRVEYNSREPATVQALAFARGNEIHLAPGQEQHLPHEAWHVVQQKRGAVHPTLQLKGREINQDARLEEEADSMGRQAAALSVDSGVYLHGNGNSRPGGITIAHPRPIIQGKWADIALLKEDPKGAPLPALVHLAELKGSPQHAELVDLFQYFRHPEIGTALYQFVQDNLRGTLADNEPEYPTDFLVRSVIELTLNRLRGTGVLGDTEMAGAEEEEGEDSPVEPILDPAEINQAELQDEPQLLMLIFRNLAKNNGYDLSDEALRIAFDRWYKSGPMTRSMFGKLCEEAASQTGGTGHSQPMQTKRTPGATSTQAAYPSSNFGPFKNVTYTLDGMGNIDFENPTSYTTWKNPQKANSTANLKKGSNKPGYGILNNGVFTKLYKASRSRHNMIANRIRPDLVAAASSTYTWHHLSQEYKMVLVDYGVHRKHGHNGGFLFWKDGK